jgi:F420-dependent oxidoreductase-like protein
MRDGLHITKFDWPGGPAEIGPRVAAIVRLADEAGFAGFWPMDHFYQIGMNGPADDPMLEGYALLNFAAGITRRMRLGLLVTGVTYRHPGVLVKEVTTLDVLSGGRAILGIGAAWHEREHRGLGVPFPSLAERFERLEEALQIAHQMWSGSTEPYAGQHYRLTETLCQPQPLQRPHPPILVGGGGERKTLRLVARYADACNLFDTPELPHKLDVLRRHCAEVGRPYDEIEKTVTLRLKVTPDGRDDTLDPAGVLGELARVGVLGLDEAIVTVQLPLVPETIVLFGERIIPEAAKLAVAGRPAVAAAAG